MEDKTQEKFEEIVDAIEEVEGVEVTGFNLNEYMRGDPTVSDTVTTGAEIEITSYLSFEEDGEDKNPFRID